MFENLNDTLPYANDFTTNMHYGTKCYHSFYDQWETLENINLCKSNLRADLCI